MLKRVRKHGHLVVLLLPALAIYLVFAVFPLADSLRLSLYDRTANGSMEFVGVSNFVYIFTDQFAGPRFWNALRNNVVFFLIHLLVQNPIGLLIAALLTSDTIRRSQGIYRTLIFIPTTLSVVIVGLIWRLILHPLWGFVDTPLLGLSQTVLPTLSLISVWQYVGIPMIFFFAVLISIPPELLDAAKVDRATAWQTFWRVKFPLLIPMFALVSIITFISNFNAFDLIYTVKGALAGPNYSSDIFGTLFYRTFFGESSQLGSDTLGATVATLMFLVILGGVALYYFALHRRTATYEM